MIRVVIADDSAPMRDKLKAELARYPGGCAIVAECVDGSAAIDAAHEHNPDIVLLDVVMSPMNGDVAARILAAGNHKVLLLTSMGQSGVIRDFPYLIKPYTTMRLYQKINSLVGV